MGTQELRARHDSAYERLAVIQREYVAMQTELEPRISQLSTTADQLATEFKQLVREAAEAYASGQKQLAGVLAGQRRAKQAECEALNAQANQLRRTLARQLEAIKAQRAVVRDLARELKQQRGIPTPAPAVTGNSDAARLSLPDGVVDYAALAAAGLDAGSFGAALSTAWAAEYHVAVPDAVLVEVELEELTYLFDQRFNRTLGVFGRSRPTTSPRPAARLRGHPSYNRAGQRPTDRGHLAAHSIGGGADINLVPQDHALNLSGEWRAFERYAQQHPGTPFAVQARYAGESDRPVAFVYALLREGRLDYRAFENAPV